MYRRGPGAAQLLHCNKTRESAVPNHLERLQLQLASAQWRSPKEWNPG